MSVTTIPHNKDPRHTRGRGKRSGVPQARSALTQDDFPSLPRGVAVDLTIHHARPSQGPDDWWCYHNFAWEQYCQYAWREAIAFAEALEEWQNSMVIKFESFPQEIREMVWTEAIRGRPYDSYCFSRVYYHFNDPVRIAAVDNIRRPYFLPEVCFLSQKTYAETVPLFIRNSHFLMRSMRANQWLQEFLNTIPNGFSHVRTLSFGFFDCFPEGLKTNADLEFAAKCPGLHTLYLGFHKKNLDEEACKIIEDGYVEYDAPTVDYLVDRYRLKQLFDCNKLREIVWVKKCRFDDVSNESLSGMMDWVQEEFMKKGRVLKCRSEY